MRANKQLRKVTVILVCICCRGLEHVNCILQVVKGVSIACCTVTGTNDFPFRLQFCEHILCFIAPTSATCTAHLTYLDVATLMTSSGEQKLSLCTPSLVLQLRFHLVCERCQVVIAVKMMVKIF